MSGTDPRTQPQAVASSNPLAALTASEGVFRPLICDLFGQQWVALGDPNTGQEINAIQVQSGVVPANNFALVTASGTFGRDPADNTWRVVDAGVLDADEQPDTRSPLVTLAALSAFNGTGASYDRLRCFAVGETFGSPEADFGILATNAVSYLLNSAGTFAIGQLSADTQVDSINQSDSNWLRTAGVTYSFNGAAFDRLGSASSTNVAAQSGTRAALAAAPGEWTLTSAPAVTVQATATRAAGAAGVRHVLRSIQASINAVAAIVAPLTVVVRDGASGAGAILWQDRLTAPAGTDGRISLVGLNIVGSEATAMTVEFTAAPGATNFETISATGYSSGASA